jgi:BlaI family transcriptional regulator, penicillinase repressor
MASSSHEATGSTRANEIRKGIIANMSGGKARRGSGDGLSSFFGPLELSVLEVLWELGAEASVRGLQPRFPGVAYTTLMTTLDRLYKKRVLVRRKSGRAYLYSPVQSREELEGGLATDALAAIVGSLSTPGSIRPLLSSFLEAMSRRDELLLDELEELLRVRRREAELEEGER